MKKQPCIPCSRRANRILAEADKERRVPFTNRKYRIGMPAPVEGWLERKAAPYRAQQDEKRVRRGTSTRGEPR